MLAGGQRLDSYLSLLLADARTASHTSMHGMAKQITVS